MSNEWSYEKLAERNYRILNENGSEIVRDIYDEQIAKQIVRNRNAHRPMLEALELLQGFGYRLDESAHAKEIRQRAEDAIYKAKKESE